MEPKWTESGGHAAESGGQAAASKGQAAALDFERPLGSILGSFWGPFWHRFCDFWVIVF